MRTILSSLLVLCSIGILPAQERRLEIVELRGTPHQRGVEHGRRLEAKIAELMTAWRENLGEQFGDADAFVKRFLANSQFEAAIRRYTPDLLDEVRGIAEGSGQPYADVLCFQLPDELWAQSDLGNGDKCSTIGVDRDGERPSFVAQNLDLPKWMNKYPTVLRIHEPDGDLESLVVTLPGLVGGNGINDHRVAVGVNTILQIRPCHDGLPVAFVVRGLLQQKSHEAALAFLRRVKHASGQAYTVGGPDTAPCFEASAGGVVAWQPEGRDGWRWHTNHPLVSSDWSPKWRASCEQNKWPLDKRRQCARYDAIGKAVPLGHRPSAEDVMAALRICGAGQPVCNDSTYVCTVMLLGKEPELHIAPGRPTEVPFEVLRFD